MTERAPDRRGAQHARQPRPLLRQRAAADRHRDLRLGGQRRGDGRALARDAAGPEVQRPSCRPTSPSSWRTRSARSTSPTSPSARPSQTFSGRLDLGVGDRTRQLPGAGPRPHRRRHDRPRPRRRHRVHRRPAVHRRAPRSCGRACSNWIAACDRILELGATTLVPGHGPVTDAAGRARRAPLPRYIADEARPALRGGHGPRAGGRRHRHLRLRRLGRPRADRRERDGRPTGSSTRLSRGPRRRSCSCGWPPGAPRTDRTPRPKGTR